MTVTTPAVTPPLGDPRELWRRMPERSRNMVRIGTFLAMVLAAYHYSLLSLAQTLALETPLAYVGLVPIIALVLAAARARTARPHLPIYDRQLDYIVGIPLLLGAAGINLVFPHRLSSMFWVWRLDLLSMPLFVAGAVCTVFGIRTMWRQGLAIGFLFLAWPAPYNLFLTRLLDMFTRFTLVGLKAALRVVPVAQLAPAGDGSLFRISHGKGSFLISVVSACSGVNGIVGFLLVGTAFGVVVRGPRLRKAAWLTGGMTLLWVLNLARILFIFWVGRVWGEKVAIDTFHPFVGLLTFNTGIVLMLLALRPFGLSINNAVFRDPDPAPGDSPAVARRLPVVNRLAVPKVGAALLVVTVFAGTLAVANADLRSFDIVATALGAPKLASFTAYPATPDGWRAQKADEYDWAKPYFGSSSTWLRYVMFPGQGGDVALKSGVPIVADVISTSNLRSFSAYGVESCYRFHGYKLRNVGAVNVGAGVTAQSMSFYNSKQKQDWTVVYWIWPVTSGPSTRYERVVLYVQSGREATFTRARPSSPAEHQSVDARTFLVDVARGVVRNQAAVRPGTSLPVENNYVPSTPSVLDRIRAKGVGTK